MTYDVIIIGSGLGGLTAGAKLARSGRKVLMIEQHNIPGGCATTFKRKDITVEVGLHEMDGLDELDAKRDIFEDLDIFNNVELIRLPEFYRFMNKRVDFVMPDNVSKAKANLVKAFPEEEKGIQKYFHEIRGIRKQVPKLPRSRFWQKVLFPLYPLMFPFVVRNASTTIGRFLDKHIQNEDLKLLLLANLGYYHNDPYSTAMIYFASAQDGYYAGGWYIRGGSQKLSDYLASVIRENGGELLLRHKVERILVENGRASGVVYRKKGKQTSESFEASAFHVIANNAVPNLAGMLPSGPAAKLRHMVEGMQASCSVITLYLGFSKPPKELGNKYYSTFLGNPEVKNLKEFADDMQHAGFDKRHLIFVDYSQIDSGLTPEGKSFGVLATTDYAKDWEGLTKAEYKAKKDQVSKVLINRLEQLIPGIKSHIEYYELGTAKTVERYTQNPGGSTYGFAQTPGQSGNKRFGQKIPVKNLHVASAWGFPGGGFTGAIIGGYLTALKIR